MSPVPGWESKIVMVYLRDVDRNVQPGVSLQDVRAEARNGESFLVGRVPHHERDWASGLEVGIRWSEVVHYLVFDGEEDYKRRLSGAPAAWDMNQDHGAS